MVKFIAATCSALVAASSYNYNYQGDLTITRSGRKCQNWNSQSPHGHRFSGAAHGNICANPDNMVLGDWCYTTDPDKRWEYCGFRREGNTVMKIPTTTMSGRVCQAWSEQTPHSHPFQSRSSEVIHGQTNMCANPDNMASGDWCYTTDPAKRWEFCGFRQNDIRGLRSASDDRFSRFDSRAAGKLIGKIPTTTKTGRFCQNWSSQTPHKHTSSVTDLGDHNLCSNPDNMPGGDWCYTTDADKRWEYCY